MKYIGDFNDQKNIKLYLQNLIKEEKLIVDELLGILRNADSYWIKNEIALFLDRYNNQDILRALIYEIEKEAGQNKNAILIDACTKYDCTEYLELFIRVILKEPGESYLWALDVISNMKGPFLGNIINDSIQKIESFINSNTDAQKNEYLENLVDFLRSHKQ